MEEAEFCFPEYINSSCRRIRKPYSVSIFIYITLSSFSLLILILNLLVIISISHFRQLQTPTNILLLSLAVSDFFVGILMLFQMLLIEGCWYLGDLMCVLYYIFVMIITSTSVGNMVLISVDRYVAICDPLHYPHRVTLKRVRICVLLCWICAFIYDTVLLKDNLIQPGRFNSCSGECVVDICVICKVIDLILTFIIPISAIVVLYLRVFVVAVSQVQAMRAHVGAIAKKLSAKVTVKKSEMKAARTLGIVVVAFLSCLCPYYIIAVLSNIIVLDASVLSFVNFMFYFNSCLNPLIYGLFYHWFRKSFKLIVTFQVLKSGSSDTNIFLNDLVE